MGEGEERGERREERGGEGKGGQTSNRVPKMSGLARKDDAPTPGHTRSERGRRSFNGVVGTSAKPNWARIDAAL